MDNKNVFLTDDITIDDFEYDNPDRYEFTKRKLDPADYPDFDKREDKKQIFEEWVDENLDYNEERYEIPMMNALRYYPDFVHFEEEECYKTASNTTLLYDTKKQAWAIGMTGGGMDLSPHLLASFIALGKGIPTELATGIRKDYNAYIDKKEHLENCKLLAEAFLNKAEQFKNYANDLK